jgi:hypothetical protein
MPSSSGYTPSRGLLLEQGDRIDVYPARNALQAPERQVALASLQAAHVRAVHTQDLSKSLLAETQCFSVWARRLRPTVRCRSPSTSGKVPPCYLTVYRPISSIIEELGRAKREEIVMATHVVSGDQYREVDRRMNEIKRQLNQPGGSPLDPDVVARGLQLIIEGPTARPAGYTTPAMRPPRSWGQPVTGSRRSSASSASGCSPMRPPSSPQCRSRGKH